MGNTARCLLSIRPTQCIEKKFHEFKDASKKQVVPIFVRSDNLRVVQGFCKSEDRYTSSTEVHRRCKDRGSQI